MIIIHNSEIDKLNDFVKCNPGINYSIVLEEKGYFTISLLTKDIDFVIESLLEDFDSVIVSEIVRKKRRRRYEEE